MMGIERWDQYTLGINDNMDNKFKKKETDISESRDDTISLVQNKLDVFLIIQYLTWIDWVL